MKSLSIRNLIEKAVSLQFSRYLMVGITAWVIDFAIFVVCHSTIGIVWAQTAARVSGALVAFAGHKVFVYKTKISPGMH